MEKVDILIIHLNGEKVIEECLTSIFSDNKTASVHILFNNTKDNSINLVKNKFPKVKLHYTKKTIGFAEASNLLAKKATSKYIVFLNNDVIVEKNWLSEMLATMKKNKNCIAVQPKIRSYFQRDCFEYAGAAGGFIDKYGYPFCRGRIFNSIEKDKGQYNDSIRIFWACGVCILTDKEFFLKSKGFDESLFMYAEELDFCWRANILGKQIWYSPKSIIYHIGSFSVNKEKLNLKKEYLITRNHLLVFLKNYSNLSLLKLLPMRILLEIIAALRFPVKKAIPLIRSIFSIPFILLGSFSKNRHEIQSKRKVSDKEYSSIVYDGSVALDHFLKGKKTFKDLLSG
ncbi:MAG: glycosyltransferase family 2 protein [Nanoarchaeota archaeon]|nr:glycosyltransferase family 2 protein [Nanoarchaeota archaeon]